MMIFGKNSGTAAQIRSINGTNAAAVIARNSPRYLRQYIVFM
jgi:hypothetical protein